MERDRMVWDRMVRSGVTVENDQLATVVYLIQRLKSKTVTRKHGLR
jgi:hypothetical protein